MMLPQTGLQAFIKSNDNELDERDAEPGAHQGEVLGAIVRAVVDVQALRQAAAHQRLLEDGQERLRVL